MQNNGIMWMIPFIEQLKRKGFLEIKGISPDTCVLYCIQNGIPYVLCFMEQNAPAYFYLETENKIRDIFIQNAYIKMELLLIVCSNDIYMSRDIFQGNRNLWLIDNMTKKLIIYENQPADFMGLRQPLENYLYAVQTRYQMQENVIYENNMQGSMNSPNSNITFGLKPESRKLFDYLTISNLLIVFNVFVFLLTSIGGDLNEAQYLVKCGGLIAPLQSGEYYRIFTAMFLHSGIIHLISNVVFIYLIGNDLEKFVSKPAFICIFLGGGMSGNLFTVISYMNAHNYNTVSVGASGACMALLGAIVVLRFFDDKVKDYISMPLLIALVVMNCSSIFSTKSNINYVAHVGGLIGGAVITLIYSCIHRWKMNK